MSIDDRYSDSYERQQAALARFTAQLMEPGILTPHEVAEIQTRAFIDRVRDAKPSGKHWVNPTPWKRGRKAQRMRA